MWTAPRTACTAVRSTNACRSRSTQPSASFRSGGGRSARRRVAARRPTYGFGNRHFGAFDGPTGGPPPPAPPLPPPPPPAMACTRFLARRTHALARTQARSLARARHRAGWGGDVAEVTDLAAPDTTDASERRALRLQAMRHAPPRTTDDVHRATCNRQRAPRNMQQTTCNAQRATYRAAWHGAVTQPESRLSPRTARAATRNQPCCGAASERASVAPVRTRAVAHTRRQRRRSLTRSITWPTLSSPTRSTRHLPCRRSPAACSGALHAPRCKAEA